MFYALTYSPAVVRKITYVVLVWNSIITLVTLPLSAERRVVTTFH